MSVAVKESVEPRKPPPNKATGQRALRPSPKVMERTKEAKLRAAAILEVLAGVRTPTDAAKALAVSLPRYYLLEQQALEAMVRGCEPKTKGPGHSLQRQVAKLQREIARLQRGERPAEPSMALRMLGYSAGTTLGVGAALGAAGAFGVGAIAAFVLAVGAD